MSRVHVCYTTILVLSCQHATATILDRGIQYVTSFPVSARVVRTWPVRWSWPAITRRPTHAARCAGLAATACSLVVVVSRANVTRTAALRCSARRQVSVRARTPSSAARAPTVAPAISTSPLTAARETRFVAYC